MSRTQHSEQTREKIRDVRSETVPEKRIRSLINNYDSSVRVTLPADWLNNEGLDIEAAENVPLIYLADESKIVIDLDNAEG